MVGSAFSFLGSTYKDFEMKIINSKLVRFTAIYRRFFEASKLVISSKRFIHSPAEKNPELNDQALAVSENQIEVFRSGIIDKTAMYEAGDDFGMKYAIWVKYPLSLFTIITVGNIAYS